MLAAMAPKKGQGNCKGKQPAKHRAPRVPPPFVSSSSDKEGWPAWEEMQAKIAALEQQKAIQARKGLRTISLGTQQGSPRHTNVLN